MLPIDPPKNQDDYPDRKRDCEEALEANLQALLDDAFLHGWSRDEARRALFRLLAADRRTEEANAETEAYLAIVRAMDRYGRS